MTKDYLNRKIGKYGNMTPMEALNELKSWYYFNDDAKDNTNRFIEGVTTLAKIINEDNEAFDYFAKYEGLTLREAIENVFNYKDIRNYNQMPHFMFLSIRRLMIFVEELVFKNLENDKYKCLNKEIGICYCCKISDEGEILQITFTDMRKNILSEFTERYSGYFLIEVLDEYFRLKSIHQKRSLLDYLNEYCGEARLFSTHEQVKYYNGAVILEFNNMKAIVY